MCGDMPTDGGDERNFLTEVQVSIIRRCVGTCRPVSAYGVSLVAAEFQSSEDVWGHADKFSDLRKNLWPPKFQSSEDVWGHADAYWAETHNGR